MGFKDDADTEIVKAVVDQYKKAESWMPFSATEIKNVFSPEELKEAEPFLQELKNAADENMKTAKLISNIGKHGKTVVKLLKLAKFIV